jgi:hypothetical protein
MLRFVFVALVISGCTVGSSTSGGPPGGGTGPDASTSPGVDAPSGTSPDAPGAGSGSNDCRNAVTTNLGNGHHNPGQDCMNGCHNHGFTVAGTVFTTANSNTAVVGATVTVKDANGQVVDIVTQLNGNFYTSTPVVFPLTVMASSCPAASKMTAQVAQGGAGCNQTNCHSTMRIHLP